MPLLRDRSSVVMTVAAGSVIRAFRRESDLLLAFSIDNLAQLVTAYGEQAADEVATAVYHWLITRIGNDGIVAWADAFGGPMQRPDQLHVVVIDGVLRDVDGPAYVGAAPIVEHLLTELGSVFVTSAGVLIANVSGSADARFQDNVVLRDPRSRQGAPWLLAKLHESERDHRWCAAYRADVQSACRLLAALAAGDLMLEWRPISKIDRDWVMVYEQARLGLCSAADDCPPWRRTSRDVEVSEMIAAAQRIGAIRAIDAWAVRETIARLRGNPALRMGYAISANSATLDGWWSNILLELATVPDLARRLIIEISLRGSFPDIEFAIELAARLRRLGCSIAVSQFGAGDAARRACKRVSPEFVKIDIGFLQDFCNGEADGVERLQRYIGHEFGWGRAVVIDNSEILGLPAVAIRAGADWLERRSATPSSSLSTGAKAGAAPHA